MLQAARRSATQAARRSPSIFSRFRHLGALGLFFLSIIDSSPLPTFAGPDILTAILAATHRNPWWEYAVVATAGSVIGAFLTFRLAKRAGLAYLDSKFHHRGVAKLLNIFRKHGTVALAISTAVPLPFPTSVFFAAAGASNWKRRRFLAIVALCRAARYSLVAILADLYGRGFVRVVRHPGRYWEWLVLFAIIVAAFVAFAIALNRRLQEASSTG